MLVHTVQLLLAWLLLGLVLMFGKFVSGILLEAEARVLVTTWILVVRGNIDEAINLRVGTLLKMLISHVSLFLDACYLLIWHKIVIVSLRVEMRVNIRLLGALDCYLVSESSFWERLHFLFFRSMLGLTFIDSILVHNEHIVSIANRMLIRHFAGLCSSRRVLLIKHIFELSHALSLFDTEFLAFLVPAPLVYLRLGESGLLCDHE